MASAAERRAAQRQLAKEIHTRSYQPSLRTAYKSGLRRQSVRVVKEYTQSGERPAKGSSEGNLIARGASFIFNDPDYEYDADSGEYDWAEDYWYHDG